MRQVAFIVDGAFFIKRVNHFIKEEAKSVRNLDGEPESMAKFITNHCLKHLNKNSNGFPERLYRIFFYDCPPLDSKQVHPLTNKNVDLQKTEMYQFRMGLHDRLKNSRNVALRLGELDGNNGRWKIKDPKKEKQFLNGTIVREDLEADDVIFYAQQKGVDIKMGLDITHLAYRRIVDKIVLISGDSDFVPAAKLARREGIEFILDPMHAVIKPNLQEHIDGLTSTI